MKLFATSMLLAGMNGELLLENYLMDSFEKQNGGRQTF